MFKSFYSFFAVFLSLFFSFTLSAANSVDIPLVLKKGAPTTYLVKKGDTLWDISALYLDSPWLWPRLWQVNPDIDNPHLIYPGDKLSLMWHNGQPVLSLKPMRKLSPQLRIQRKNEALPTLPDGLVLPYIKSDRLVTDSVLDTAQHVLGTSEGRKYLSANERVYISGEHTHREWGIYRWVGELERDEPDVSMTSLRLVATATLVQTNKEFSGLSVVSQQQEILPNDIVLPEVGLDKLSLSRMFYPGPAKPEMTAHILGSIDGARYTAVNQVVVIDRGTHDNLRQGTMFHLIEAGSEVYGDAGEFTYDSLGEWGSIQLPDTLVGSIMVIRPYEYFSLAIITNSQSPVSKRSLAVSPLIVNSVGREAK
ncbi:peptidoglycan-binding protein [Vibrio albus]|uniref:Peptidoglycan-binding protein n=1 Tax=Vibrio albus TaxID=2200953 RepID=A0A2U3B4W2_9VIBR|nr:LysM peptidoglycan-binding domain-containing protein [Vibrio albus]PWI31826.1 peptidoglycan-binding protein [Vibrio albus]